jgi:hypothetical protein
MLADRAQADSQKLKEERQEMLAQFQRLVEDHRLKMESELQQSAEKVYSAVVYFLSDF